MAKEKEETVTQDVNKTPGSSAEGSIQTKDLDDTALEAINKEKAIPYGRFKEINEQKKALEAQVKHLQSQFEVSRQRAEQDAELRAEMRLRREKEEVALADEDPWTKIGKKADSQYQNLEMKVRELNEQLKAKELNETLKDLKNKFPHANELAALGIKKANPSVDLEEIMASLHQNTVEAAEGIVRGVLDQKKKKAESTVPTRSQGFKLKEEDRPKSIKDATRAAMKWLESQ